MTPKQPQLPPPILVETPDALAELVDELHAQPRIAVDTESNSLHAYQEQVCLIQVSTPDTDYLIDTIVLDDLAPFGEIIARPDIEKIFHAAEYDIMTLRRDFAFEFAHLFDTQIAARILSWERVGLGSILEDEFDVLVSKRFQRADWGERPLNRAMIRYAQMDTHYLLALRERLGAELAREGRLEEAQEAFGELLLVPPFESEFDPYGFWNIHGAHDLLPHQQAILRELYLFREDAARKRDCPPFKVMHDNTLLAIAEREPLSSRELINLNGLGQRQARRYEQAILASVRRGQNASEPLRPPRRPHRPDDAVLARYDALHTWRKERARKRGVESDVIISKDALWQLAKRNPRTAQQLDGIEGFGPWKRKTYGSEILQILSGVNS